MQWGLRGWGWEQGWRRGCRGEAGRGGSQQAARAGWGEEGFAFALLVHPQPALYLVQDTEGQEVAVYWPVEEVRWYRPLEGQAHLGEVCCEEAGGELVEVESPSACPPSLPVEEHHVGGG